ncbi:hypothetical protein CVT24_005107 [Panaeolus cyanescens]|uniref:F-box domain-containing protein n=1 Tax=Panaeolus cyanescens TaxID=181874 RepID=A0A409VPU2_9AGAR|nr:hypothetical protein CVT24_005107 [Panaeolus cyanescens]
MGFENLPTELTEEIFSYLLPKNSECFTREHRKLLIALAGCNAAFNAWAVPRLFREIRIVIAADDQHLERFREILAGRPVLASLVQSFTFCIRVPFSHSSSSIPTVYEDIHLPFILSQLQNLKSFALKVGPLPNYRPLDWDRLPRSWSKALQNVCRLPSITKLELLNIRFMKSGWILHCKNLKELSIWRIMDRFGNPQGSYSWSGLTAETAPKLTKLQFDKINACIDKLYKLGCLSMLQTIETVLSLEQDSHMVRQIIEGASDHLEALDLRWDYYTESIGRQINFQQWRSLSVLRQLTIDLSDAFFPRSTPHAADFILAYLLRLPPRLPCIETIQLIASPQWRDHGPPNIYAPSRTWPLVEQHCARAYHSLHTLIIEFENSTPFQLSMEGSYSNDDDNKVEMRRRKEKRHGLVGVDVSDRIGVKAITVLVKS